MMGLAPGAIQTARGAPMAFRIEEKFRVQAPADRVWAYLIDPRRVVICMPGAELAEVVDERTFLGNLKVKVGPVTVSYKARVRLTEVDAGARRVRMVAEGRETGGAGSVKVAMASQIAPLAGGGAEVAVEADVDLAGRIVQFGRGLIGDVSKQLFRQFAECVKAELEAPAGAGTTGGGGSADAPGAQQPGGPVPPPAQPVRAIPLLLAALRATGARLWRRLAGGGTG
jgi:carbon monoxide dehydrogenase subunit G